LLRLHRRSLIIADGTNRNGGVVIGSAHLERVDARGGAFLLIADSRRHTIQLQPGASGTRPRICRGRVAFDFSTSTALTSSHHYKSHSQPMHLGYADTERGTHPSSACDGYARRRRHSLANRRLAQSLEHAGSAHFSVVVLGSPELGVQTKRLAAGWFGEEEVARPDHRPCLASLSSGRVDGCTQIRRFVGDGAKAVARKGYKSAGR
jgi:hypothetical protein